MTCSRSTASNRWCRDSSPGPIYLTILLLFPRILGLNLVLCGEGAGRNDSWETLSCLRLLRSLLSPTERQQQHHFTAFCGHQGEEDHGQVPTHQQQNPARAAPAVPGEYRQCPWPGTDFTLSNLDLISLQNQG